MNDTLQTIHALLSDMDPNLDPTNEAYKVAVVLLASAQVGTDVLTLSQLTQYNAEWVALISSRLIESGIWKDGCVYSDWLDEEYGGVNFWLDVCVGQGYLEVAE